jgi:hypothetical protein
MNSENSAAIEKLCFSFPRLTEANQQYVLGLAEGLKKAQNNRLKELPTKGENEPRKADV